MNTKSAQLWYVLAAVAAALILVAGYLLLVSPTNSDASDLTTQTETVQAQNVATQGKIAQLQAESKNLPAQQQAIAAVRNKIPDNPALPTLVRALSDQAKSSGVVLQSVTPSVPTTSGALSDIPVSLKVTGDFANIRLYVNSLETMQRAFFVGGLDIARGTTGGTTTADTGSLNATITGTVFMSADFTAAPAPAPATATTTTPATS